MKWLKRLLLAFLSLLVLLLFGAIFLYGWGGQSQLAEDQYVTTLNEGEVVAPATDSLIVVTYNLGWLSGMTNNLPVSRTDSLYQVHFDRLVAVFTALSPTLIGLQEVDYNAQRSHYWQQGDSLAKALSLLHRAHAVNWDKRYVPFPYWPPSLQFGPMLSGQSTLSQLPILDHQREVLPMPESSFLYTRFYIDRLIQTTILNWQDTSIAFLNVHLEAWAQNTRKQQCERVAQLADSLRHYHLVLLVGDFNAEPPQRFSKHSGNYDSTLLPLLERGFEATTFTAQQQEGWMNSFSSVDPSVSIDHLFFHPDQWTCTSTRVLTEIGDVSDHLPVIAVFHSRSKTPFKARKNQENTRSERAIPLIE